MQLIRNAIQTPDGTVLESYHRHDYKSHTDANGERYIIDGGLDYIRTSQNKVPAKSLALTTDDPHEVVREHLKWGTYGKNGDEALKWVSLSEMSSEHILAVFDNVPIPKWRKDIYLTELKNRGAL